MGGVVAAKVGEDAKAWTTAAQREKRSRYFIEKRVWMQVKRLDVIATEWL